MVPVLDRPVMAHIVDLLDRQGFDEVIAEPPLLPGHDPRLLRRPARRTARSRSCSAPPAACATAPTSSATTPFLVISGDALDGHRPGALRRAPQGGRRHRDAGGQAGRGHARVRRRPARRGGPDHRLPGEAATPPRRCRTWATAACTVRARDLRLLPRQPFVDWAHDVFPALLGRRRPVPRPRDRRVLERRRLARRARRARSTRCAARCASRCPARRSTRACASARAPS